MRLRFLWIGKTKDPLHAGIEGRYLERLRKFFPTERAVVAEQQKKDRRQVARQSEREAQSIEQRLSGNAYLVIVDERGRQFSSLELAEFLRRLMNQSVPEVAFVVGGHQGIPDKIKGLSNLKLSLSKMTLPHELARIVLLEQIYRAVSILKGLPYHKGL